MGLYPPTEYLILKSLKFTTDSHNSTVNTSKEGGGLPPPPGVGAPPPLRPK